jgi:hypothetical protein
MTINRQIVTMRTRVMHALLVVCLIVGFSPRAIHSHYSNANAGAEASVSSKKILCEQNRRSGDHNDDRHDGEECCGLCRIDCDDDVATLAPLIESFLLALGLPRDDIAERRESRALPAHAQDGFLTAWSATAPPRADV